MKKLTTVFTTFFFLLFVSLVGFLFGGARDIKDLCDRSNLSFGELLSGEDDYQEVSGGYYYELLSEEEQYVYRKIDKAHDENNEIISCFLEHGVEISDLPHIFQAYINDHPAAFNFSPYVKRTVTDYGNLKQRFIENEEIDTSISEDEILSKVKKLVEDISTEDKEEAIKAVNDLICENYVYREYTDYAGDIRSMVKNSTGVCVGYSQLFKLCMDELGIDCIIINGESVIDEARTGHSWNAVKIGDEWKLIDVTWSDQDEYEYINYDYFLKNPEEFDNHYAGSNFTLDFME